MPRRVGRGGADGVAPRVHEGVFPVSARDGSGPWGVSHAPHEGAAEGTEDVLHRSGVCCLQTGVTEVVPELDAWKPPYRWRT